jgi:outer membrane protein assembly factor BamB
MKRINLAFLILPFIFSCVLYSTPPLGEINFPLKRVKQIPIGGDIGKIAVGNTWIAVQTRDAITALDIDTFETLWTLNIQVSPFGEGFQLVDDMLITASEKQVVILDKHGSKKEIDVDEDVKPIIKILEVNSGFIYVVGGPKWTVEAYDSSRNAILWKKRVGRGIIDVTYDSPTKLVYVTIDDTVYVNDNLTGEFLQKAPRRFGEHLINRILYTLTNSAKDDMGNHYEISAVDTETQKTLWQNSFILPADNYVGDLLALGDLLIFSGDGMIAFDKSNGMQLWRIDVHTFGEEFLVPPVEFDNTIYAMGYASNTVFAISPDNGSIIGTANLEGDSVFGAHYGEVFGLKDGILFNTSDSVVIYKK